MSLSHPTSPVAKWDRHYLLFQYAEAEVEQSHTQVETQPVQRPDVLAFLSPTFCVVTSNFNNNDVDDMKQPHSGGKAFRIYTVLPHISFTLHN